MAENNKKFDKVSIAILALLGVALIMGIVGICVAWLATSNIPKELAMGGPTSGADTLTDLMDANKLYKALYNDVMFANVEAIQAMGIIAIIAAALTAISYAVSKFVNIKALKFVTIGLAVVLIVCALIALILTFTCTNTEFGKAYKEAGTKFTPAAGCWLLSIFGVIGGAAGIYGGIKG